MGTTEDEMVGWHHRLDGHEFEQTPGDSEGQGSLICFSPWGHKQLDITVTEQQQGTYLLPIFGFSFIFNVLFYDEIKFYNLNVQFLRFLVSCFY